MTKNTRQRTHGEIEAARTARLAGADAVFETLVGGRATIKDLEKRRDLLKEIKELSQWCPDEDERREVADHLATLKEIAEMDQPNEDDIKDAADHLATLKEIAETDQPNEDDIKDAADHLATLQAIAETADPTDAEITAASDHLATLKAIEA